MKHNFRKTFASLCIGVVAFGAVAASAQTVTQESDYSRDKLLQESMLLLDKVELDAPRSHADLVKLRERIQAIFQSSDVNCADDESGVQGPMLSVRKAARRNKRNDWEAFYSSLKGLNDVALRQKLREKITNQKTLDYTDSRRFVMMQIDNYDEYVECIYTGKVYPVREMPKPTVLNVEHSWPQSHGATGIAKADLHHLFPTDPIANSTRSSLSFGMVENPKWAEGGSKCDGKRFEVRKKYRGNIARALFYFSTRYGKTIDSGEENVLRQWNKEDPIDATEKARNDRVEEVQGNRNPFIDHPEFIDSINDF